MMWEILGIGIGAALIAWGMYGSGYNAGVRAAQKAQDETPEGRKEV